MAADYPFWSALLAEIGEEIGVRSADVYDLAALAQWSIQENGGATRVRSVTRREVDQNRDLPETLRIIAYFKTLGIKVGELAELFRLNDDPNEDEINVFKIPEGLALSIENDNICKYIFKNGTKKLWAVWGLLLTPGAGGEIAAPSRARLVAGSGRGRSAPLFARIARAAAPARRPHGRRVAVHHCTAR